MEYLGEILWYISLPITVWISVKFVQHNLKHFNKLERLEIYEKNDQTLQQKDNK
jgi:hypothetical protein